ncbi:MAG TPA: phenylalanine--tRNA ligase subunit beta, partial [Polyangiaceae bacterium]|nr:phenylalanine--tRNA ligase subunit beta [Polyangiaceae bacterium]
LQEHFEDGLDILEVSERLTLSGIEVEKVWSVGVYDPLVVVGEVASVEPVPGIAGMKRVEVLADRRRQLISNAAGVEPGRKLAVALPGATLFADDGLSLLSVEEATLYGQRSEGALCSTGHLGTGSDFDVPVALEGSSALGSPLFASLSARPEWQADRVLLLSILPNIARCQSLRGVAREVSALLRKPRKALLEPLSFESDQGLSPSITARDACLSLTTTLIEGVTVSDSPDWLRKRLVLAGMTPINNIVDVTNYVMLEFGQPTHAYDADLLPSLDLGVRHARSGDRLLTLQQADGEEPLVVPEGVPLIVSGDRPVAAAGVIGGRPTAISASTRRVLLESAAFELVAIRRAQQALKTFTEASARFSRGVNPELPIVAARRFLELLRLTAPDARVTSYGQVSHGISPARRISLSLSQLNESLGTGFTLAQSADTLRRGGLVVEADARGAALNVQVDNSRLDLTLACDLIEEIARLEGYETLPETMPTDAIPEPLQQDAIARREAVRDRLVRMGLQEIISYSLNGPALEAKLYAGRPSAQPKALVKVLNPVSVERSVLRSSLLPGLLSTAALNLRHQPLCRLFEIGPVFAQGAAAEELPNELSQVALLIAGSSVRSTLHDKKPRDADLFDAKALAQELFDGLRLQGLTFEASDEVPYRPGACARIVRGGEVL